ncbi:hypothetical protein BpHYR1_004900 [Brachionus plicatilis]|uniref:Uncharacterized protein n=1 Tax=Brachionus plicatilis TaxID=10195 RepID=A0A3M7RQZ1_BRAPC|nr:hypothetical protein BpHYR1_004900 [Brachionus plicatilis]
MNMGSMAQKIKFKLKFTKFKTLVLSEFHIFDSKLTIMVRHTPTKTATSFFFLNYISIFIFEILSLKEQQLFKGFAIFGTVGKVSEILAKKFHKYGLNAKLYFARLKNHENSENSLNYVRSKDLLLVKFCDR